MSVAIDVTTPAVVATLTDRELLEDIHGSIKNMERLVTSVVEQALPVIETLKTQGPMGLMRMMM